ncbi:Hypothetical protein, putative [Bodo saltans]|uniref:Uncharacterized protein n=1 Tax=Bodo saltans TaxID=75058 RepID=A0A0S4JFD5_BODSA|nr:Hypothetical protein, putative [Bodo saltans]|eukprot:CUG88149.1 Hypothetical protein, putative [Bodo saltans]
MATNFWATALGFDREDRLTSGSQAVSDLHSIPIGTEATIGDEKAELEGWMNMFHRRMEQRELAIAKAQTAQLHRDDEEIEKWKLVRDSDEAELLRKHERHKREQQEAADARSREEEAQREQTRIMIATAGMTDAERESWLVDERELELLQNKQAAQASRLQSLNAVLMKSVEYLAAKEKAEMEECQRLEDLRALQQSDALRDQEQQRILVDALENDHRHIILAEEPLARNLLHDASCESHRLLVNTARAQILTTLDSPTKLRLQNMSQSEANEILDDLVLLSDMQRTVDKLTCTSIKL